MIHNIQIVLEIFFSVAIIGLVIIQPKGTGLGSSFGGSGEMFRSKRGAEKTITYLTVIFAVLFAINSVVLLILK